VAVPCEPSPGFPSVRKLWFSEGPVADFTLAVEEDRTAQPVAGHPAELRLDRSRSGTILRRRSRQRSRHADRDLAVPEPYA
jgi:hypothetical protein